MRFGISNLIFDHISNNTVEAILSHCTVCDFAPTVHYGSWENVPGTLPEAPFLDHETKVSALQSLFYQVPDVSLVRDDKSFQRLKNHFRYVVDLAATNKTPFLIFGSPGVRSKADNSVSHGKILERVCCLADYAFKKDVKLCFEVNSTKFGCDFLTTNQSLFDLLSRLNHQGLALHLDVGQMIEEGLDPLIIVDSYKDQISHMHLSSPDFTFQPDMFQLYASILKQLANRQVDIILEIQSMGCSSESSLIKFCKDLGDV
jgi:sugar phosphate isomerase/epimerase